MARLLRDVLKRRVIKDLQRKAENLAAARKLWEEAVPAQYRGYCRAVGYKRRVLAVAADSPAVLAELEGFYKREVEGRLKEAFSARGLPPPVRVQYIVEERL